MLLAQMSQVMHERMQHELDDPSRLGKRRLCNGFCNGRVRLDHLVGDLVGNLCARLVDDDRLACSLEEGARVGELYRGNSLPSGPRAAQGALCRRWRHVEELDGQLRDAQLARLVGAGRRSGRLPSREGRPWLEERLDFWNGRQPLVRTQTQLKGGAHGRVVAQRNRRLCLVREHRELVFAARERVVQHAVCERGRLATLIRIHTREDAHLTFVRGRESERRLDEALEGVPRASFASELIRLEQLGEADDLGATAGQLDGLSRGDRLLKGELDSVVEVARPEDVMELLRELKLLAAEAQALEDVGEVGIALREPLGARRQVRADKAQAGVAQMQGGRDRALVADDSAQSGRLVRRLDLRDLMHELAQHVDGQPDIAHRDRAEPLVLGPEREREQAQPVALAVARA